MRTPLIALLFLVHFLPATLAAQVGANARANVDFRTIAIGGEINGVNFKDGEKYSPLQARDGVIGGTVYRYSGPATMELYRNQQVNGKAQMAPAGSIVFQPPSGQSSATGRYLVVMVSINNQVTGAAMPDTSSGFPPSSVRIFNASNSPMEIHVNDTKVPLRGGEFKIMPLGNATRLEIRAFMMYNGELAEITNNVFTNTSLVRRTIFFVLRNAAQLRADPTLPPEVEMINYMERPNEGARSGAQRRPPQ